MTPAIGANAAGTNGIGAALAQGGGSPAAGAPPGLPGGANPSGMPGAGMDAQRQMLEQQMGQIRQIAEGVKQLAAVNPTLAPLMQQIQELLKQAVMAAAQPAPQQTASGMAVPTAGQ